MAMNQLRGGNSNIVECSPRNLGYCYLGVFRFESQTTWAPTQPKPTNSTFRTGLARRVGGDEEVVACYKQVPTQKQSRGWCIKNFGSGGWVVFVAQKYHIRIQSILFGGAVVELQNPQSSLREVRGKGRPKKPGCFVWVYSKKIGSTTNIKHQLTFS